MNEPTLVCIHRSSDCLKGWRVGGGVWLGVYESGTCRVAVMQSPSVVRAFARELIALADEVDGGEVPVESTLRPVATGDRVRVVHPERTLRGTYTGALGTVDEIDADDDRLPYRVITDGGAAVWCYEVERVGDSPDPHPPTRADLVGQAKALLSGVEHAADDVIRLAEFLAGAP
ncbi:hypothetical protein ACIP88_05225 [Streptomyces uncialis]|uniref:hypothetical protein n=1 Tax=Streptomyces uncialis TaxID=1048205 RepID=UPI0038239A96